jgi:hypothetical protein
MRARRTQDGWRCTAISPAAEPDQNVIGKVGTASRSTASLQHQPVTDTHPARQSDCVGRSDPTSPNPTLRLNPHGARGTGGARPPAISCLGAFQTPDALGAAHVGWPIPEELDDARPTAPAKVRFAGDSPLEGDGFEPSVPRESAKGFRHYPANRFGTFRCCGREVGLSW